MERVAPNPNPIERRCAMSTSSSERTYPHSFKPGEIGTGDIVDLAEVHNVTVIAASFLSQTAKVRYYDPRNGETIDRNVSFGEIYGWRRPEGRVFPNPDLPRYGLSTGRHSQMVSVGYDPVRDGYPEVKDQLELPLESKECEASQKQGGHTRLRS